MAREISIDGKEVRVRANPLTLLFYRQEFGTDLIGDLLSLERMKADPSQFDGVLFLQIVWAMAKTDKSTDFPSFERWVASLESVDFADSGLLDAVMEEAMDGFFRSASKGAKQRTQPRT